MPLTLLTPANLFAANYLSDAIVLEAWLASLRTLRCSISSADSGEDVAWLRLANWDRTCVETFERDKNEITRDIEPARPGLQSKGSAVNRWWLFAKC